MLHRAHDIRQAENNSDPILAHLFSERALEEVLILELLGRRKLTPVVDEAALAEEGHVEALPARLETIAPKLAKQGDGVKRPVGVSSVFPHVPAFSKRFGILGCEGNARGPLRRFLEKEDEMTANRVQDAPAAFRAHLEAADRKGNNNKLVDTIAELDTASLSVCKEEARGCASFFAYAFSIGFPQFRIEERMSPGTPLHALMLGKVRRYGRKLLLRVESRPERVALCEMLEEPFPLHLKERILRDALRGLEGASPLGRMESLYVLQAAAQSDLPASLKEEIAMPALRSLKYGSTKTDADGNSDFAYSSIFGKLAPSLRIDTMLAIASDLMDLLASKNHKIRWNAENALSGLISGIRPAETKRAFDFLLEARKSGNAAKRQGSIVGLKSLSEREQHGNVAIAEEAKLRILELLLESLGDRAREVRYEAASGLKPYFETKKPELYRRVILERFEQLRKRSETEPMNMMAIALGPITTADAARAPGTKAPDPQAAIRAHLLAMFQQADKKTQCSALDGIGTLVNDGHIAPNDALVDGMISLLRADEMCAYSARETLAKVEQKAEGPLASRIKKALNGPADQLVPPKVVRVRRSPGPVTNNRSERYVVELEYPELPAGAASAQLILNGYEQPRAALTTQRTRSAIFMDWRDVDVSAVVKIYDRKKKLLAETKAFQIENPGYRVPKDAQ
jgi:hypothetical protein